MEIAGRYRVTANNRCTAVAYVMRTSDFSEILLTFTPSNPRYEALYSQNFNRCTPSFDFHRCVVVVGAMKSYSLSSEVLNPGSLSPSEGIVDVVPSGNHRGN